MKTLNLIIISIISLVLLSGVASATEWTILNASGLGYTNHISDQFTITRYNTSTTYGLVGTYSLVSDSSYSAVDLFTHCNNCLYGMINPIDNSRWGIDTSGNVFYTTQIAPVDYSLGFYEVSPITETCQGIGGNCNNLRLASTITPTTTFIKLSFDSSGNVYVLDPANYVVTKYLKSLGYSPQTFYTISSFGACDHTSDRALGIKTDQYDNTHLLWGCKGGGIFFVHRFNVSSSGSLNAQNIINTGLTGTMGDGGGLVLDYPNSSNFTYAIYKTNVPTDFLLNHWTWAGSTVIANPLGTVTSIGDIGYSNNQIYVSSPMQSKVVSYVTNFQGNVFSQTPTNPDGITGTFDWKNGYGVTVTTITPGMSLAYRWTIDSTDAQDANYTYFSGWGTDTQTEPGNLRDLTELNSAFSSSAVFSTSSTNLAGSVIYGYIVARRNNDSTWSILATPSILTINPSSVGYDSITLDKSAYNLTGDTIQATFTYGGGWPFIYKWQICTRVDCADGEFFNQMSLVAFPQTSSMATDGLKAGNYYAVMMRHLPLVSGLTNEIVAYQKFEVRPPIISVSWDKPIYNLLPKTQASNCVDSTPSLFHWTNVTGYAGLVSGWFSCDTIPPNAAANNSIMRGSLYSRNNSVFYLNNSLGNIWNGSLYNGSGAIVYVLTNSSTTETWTLIGVNESGDITVSANAEVAPADATGYSLSVSPNPAYNLDTLYLTFTKPIYLIDYVIIRDAGGVVVASFDKSAVSGSYYIDPNKQYTYGTWTAYWAVGSLGTRHVQGQDIFTFEVKNSGRPKTVVSVTPPESGIGAQTDNFLSSGMFIALIILMVFASAGHMIGGLPGATLGFGVGIIYSTYFDILPMWALFLFAILVITVFAIFMGKGLVGGGQD